MRSPSPFAVVAAAVLLGAAPSARGAPPEEPLVLTDIPEIGQPGGSLRMLVGRTRDTRLFTVYGHARLVGYAPDLAFVPDILASFTVEEGRIFTFRLRRGHRWSDGAPFTTEDFRFWWEDVALDTELSPLGPPVEMLVDGEPPRVEVLDPLTIRYVWSKPNPLFLPALARATPLFIYAPAHYLKRFHRRYADPAVLQRLVSQDRARDWVQLFGRRERMYESDNPDLPTLEPWMPTTRPPAQRFVAIRNPFFHRVDERGQQLPYIDRFVLELVDGKLIAMKTAARETDLQGRGLSFRDYTFLKESEGRSGLEVRLWKEKRGAHLAFYPNLNAADPVWRGLFRDRRFRLALSLAIDREMLAQYLYFGLATPANNTILPESPLWSDEVGTACLGHDPAQANALLDALGLDREQDGVRRLPDGRPLELVIETPGEEPEQLDVIELLADDFAAIGLRIHGRPSERELLRNRLFAGQALMTIWYGIKNGCRGRRRARTSSSRRASSTSRNGRNGVNTSRLAARLERPSICPKPVACSTSLPPGGMRPRPPSRRRSGATSSSLTPSSAGRSASSGTCCSPSPSVAACTMCRSRRSGAGSRTPSSASTAPTRSSTGTSG